MVAQVVAQSSQTGLYGTVAQAMAGPKNPLYGCLKAVFAEWVRFPVFSTYVYVSGCETVSYILYKPCGTNGGTNCIFKNE